MRIGFEADSAKRLELGLLQDFEEAQKFDTLIKNLSKNPATYSLRRLQVSYGRGGINFEWVSADKQIRRFAFPKLPKFEI